MKGEDRLRASIRKTRRPKARKEAPTPYDDDWGWWTEQRLTRLEDRVKWLIGLAAATLAAEVIRIALTAIGISP